MMHTIGGCLVILGGAYAPPFCAVGRLSAPLNAPSVCWKGLSIRRQEVFEVLGGASLSAMMLSDLKNLFYCISME